MSIEERLLEVLVEYKESIGKDVWLCDMQNKILASTLSLRDVFLRKVLSGQMSGEEISRQVEFLQLNKEKKKILFLLQIKKGKKEEILEILANLFPKEEEDFIFDYLPSQMIIFKYCEDDFDEEAISSFVSIIQDMVEGDSYSKICLSSSLPFSSWENLERAFRQAKRTLEAGIFFKQGSKFFAYESLRIERLVWIMSDEQCQDFIEDVQVESKEIFSDKELIHTVNELMVCQGNLAETARKLYIHRNTLNYRLDKIKRLTKLDVKKYEDASVFHLLVLVYQRMNR